MKSREEIRRHRDDLRIAMDMPCGCDSNGHADDCFRGLMMMKSTESTLSWVLGENDDLQGMVDRMARDVVAFRRQN
jgi:hypothetical protein